MKKILTTFFLILISFNSYSKTPENNMKWITIQIPYNYVLKNDLKYNSKCNIKLLKLIDIVKEKNKNVDIDNLKAENFLEVPRCQKSNKVYIGENKKEIQSNNRVSDISEWYKMKVPKRFILSKQLVENNCSEIWTKQINLFKSKNPSIINVNKIETDENILIQKCGELKKIVKESEKNHQWYLFYGQYKKNEEDTNNLFGLSLNLKLIDLIEYDLDIFVMDNTFLFNSFSIPLIEKEKDNFYLGTSFANNIERKPFNYFFLKYNRQFSENWKLSFLVGTNFKSSNSIFKTSLEYKSIKIFHKYFKEENILDENLNFNDYNLLGLGFTF